MESTQGRRDARLAPRRFMSLAILSLLVALAAAGAGAERVRVEPQIGPYQPQKVQFHPTERWHLLVVEGDGKVGVWDMEDKEDYRRLLTIYTNAADATFTADGAAIVTAGLDGKLRLWDLDGVERWESKGGHEGGATSVVACSATITSVHRRQLELCTTA